MSKEHAVNLKGMPTTLSIKTSFTERLSKKLALTREGPSHPGVPASATSYASAGLGNEFSMKDFKKNLKVTIMSCTDELLRLDLSGVDASVSNAIRRVMISEVPTVAIDKVHLWQNTGVIQDEILCHRLGLVPIWVPDIDSVESAKEEGDDFDIAGAIKFKLHVKCPMDYPKGQNLHVYSKDMKFEPQSKAQQDWPQPPRPVHGDILLAKLRPGQEIECELYCLKGIGRIHAKWSPVCTASYRLMPQVTILEEQKGEAAHKLVDLCPKKVFDIEDNLAVVKRPRDCSACRRCIEEIPQGIVELAKVKDHFIFSVESSGCMPAAEIFARALGILVSKCEVSRKHLTAFTTGEEEVDGAKDADMKEEDAAPL
jgi:DNA-directed RNA polymerase I and III subunit RPAC1